MKKGGESVDPPDQKNNNFHYLNKQAAKESNARSYPRRLPFALKKASGSWIEDVEGNRYLDSLCGAGTLALGHNHPEIIETLKDVLDSELPLHTLDITTPTKDRFVDLLFEKLPGNLRNNSKIQFCGPTGSDAVDAAIKLCKTATGNESVISFQGGYHGMGHGALALTGNLGAKNAINGLMPGVQFFPYPYIYRCPFGLGGEAGIDAASHYFERVLKDPESGIRKPAAVILEAVQGEGGVIPAPGKWLQTVRRVTEELGIPLILDEIQAGIGRTGKFFAFEHAGITPDVILISKAIGGSLPLSVIIYHEKLDVWQPGAHAGTFRGNQMAMAAGTKVLEIIDRDDILKRVKEKGEYIRSRLNALKESVSIIGDVRGLGFMKGVEFIDPRQPLDHLGAGVGSGEIAGVIQNLCFQNKVILEKGGRFGAVMRFMPALNISDDDLDHLLSVFEKVTREVDQQYA